MNHHDRLKQLHTLADRLARLPASPERDRMLAEVRIRAVDVETGVDPEPMRPLEPEPAVPATTAATKPRAARPRPPAKTPAWSAAAAIERFEALAPAPRPGRDEPPDVLETSGVLCLGDSPDEPPASGARVSSPPWARGLRG
jgi:hypothetical protein